MQTGSALAACLLTSPCQKSAGNCASNSRTSTGESAGPSCLPSQEQLGSRMGASYGTSLVRTPLWSPPNPSSARNRGAGNPRSLYPSVRGATGHLPATACQANPVPTPTLYGQKQAQHLRQAGPVRPHPQQSRLSFQSVCGEWLALGANDAELLQQLRVQGSSILL